MPRWRSALSEHAGTIALVAITAIGAGIRFGTLGLQSLDHDEAVTAMQTLQPTLGGTLDSVLHIERTPPLYYLLAWIWAKPLGFGMGVLDLRALSAIFGSLTVPVAFLAGREFATRRAGLIAAAFVALNPFLVWYSQEARAYALLVFLTALGLYFFARALREPRARNLVGWSMASILALASHYFAAFVIIPEAIWLIVLVRPRLHAFAAASAVGAVGFALLPLAILQEGAGHPDGFTKIPVLERTWESVMQFASSYSPSYSSNILSSNTTLAGIQVTAGAAEIFLLVAAFMILWRLGKRDVRHRAIVCLSVGVIAIAIPLGLAFAGGDYLDSRNLIIAVVPLLVAGAIGLGAAGARRAGAIAAGVVCAVFACVLVAVNMSPQLQRRDWSGVANAVGPTVTRRVVIVPRTARYPLLYYLRATRFGHYAGPVFTRQVDLITDKSKVTPPVPSFRRVDVRRINGGLWLWRYSFARPEPVYPRSIYGGRTIHQPAAGLITGSAPAGRQPAPNVPPGQGVPA